MTENAPKGLVSLYAPSDLFLAWKSSKPGAILEPLTLLKNYLGGSPQEVPEQYQTGSPLLLATAELCPTLLVHGQKDKLVWCRQSERLEARLRDLKVPVTFLAFPGPRMDLTSTLGGLAASFLRRRFGVSSRRFSNNDVAQAQNRSASSNGTQTHYS